MKKSIGKVLLPSLIIITALLSFTFTANAEGTQDAIISNTTVQASPGETIATTLKLNAGSNAAAFSLYLTYDQENLTLLSAKENNECEGTLVMNYKTTPGQISISFSAANNITSEMPFVDLEFKVDDNIGIGAYDIVKLDISKASNARTLQGSQSASIPFNMNFSPFSIYESGDVDLDGEILSIDATFILRHTVGLTVLSDVQLYYADAYTDAVVDTFDATWILRHTVGYDVQLGNRVNVIFHRLDGSIYTTKSVAFGEDLTRLPAVPYEEGFTNGRWSMSPVGYVELALWSIEKAVNIYPVYEQTESAAMKFYKQRLTERYYLDPTHILPETNLRLIDYITYQNGKYARIYWSSDKSGIFNATNGTYSQPNYDQEVNLVATIVAYSGESIEAQEVLLFPFVAQGKYPTPTKAEIATYLNSVVGSQIDCNMLLPQKVTNREVERTNPYEVRIEWEIVGSDAIKHPVVQLSRNTISQNVNLIATITFNGIPLEGDGKVYFDNVTLTAITEAEIRYSIIQQIAANTKHTLTTGDILWDDDQVYSTNVQWISKDVTIANIYANTVDVRPTAIDGSSLPMEVRVSYLSDKGDKEFYIAYTASIKNRNTLLFPGKNIQQALYDALIDETGIDGNLSAEHLKTPTFVYLDLSKHPDITDLSGLTYCKNLRVLNISGLHIERALNEISTLNNLEALIARDCGIDNLTDGGIPVLKTAINLKLLDLSHNNFTSLNSVLAENVMYAKLQEVYLNNNRLTDISALKRAPILYFLSMSNNGLTSSDIENFASFKYLRYLSISDNAITSLAPLKELKNLMELRLHNNQITNVRDLQTLVNMRALYLGSNQITDVTWLNNLRQLQVLYLNDNRIADISSLTALTQLAALNVSGNEIQNLNMLSACKPTMKELYAENNEIRSFSFLSGMANLRKLMLSGNVDTVEPALPNNLAALTNLKTLTISGKPLSTGLVFLDNMTKLTRLDVSACRLPTGSDAHLPISLQYLDISNNTDLVINSASTQGIYELDGLVGLYADNMQGSIKPEQLFALMSELKYVSLESCGIESISWLSRFINLVYVDLAGNPIAKIDLNSMPATLKRTLKYLILDAETTPSFIDAYYAYNGIGDVPLEIVSLSGSKIDSMMKMPYLDCVRYLNLSNTGITNLNEENPEVTENYTIERYQTVETLDLSGLQASIAPIENLSKLETLYAVGTGEDQIFYRENILSLYRLYNKGITAFLYSKDEEYKPVAQREGDVILGQLPDISCTVGVAADNLFSDNNPNLAASINDFPITWSVSNSVNYKIESGKLAVASYTNLVDEELTLTAKISVYPYQIDVTRDFKIQTDILRASEAYINRVEPGEAYVRGEQFQYDVTVNATMVEASGFSAPAKPVFTEIRYTYDSIQPWNQIFAESQGHHYQINELATLGAKVVIHVAIGHNDPNTGFVTDWTNPGTEIEVVSRKSFLTYYLNEGTASGIADGNPISKAEEAVIADFVPERPGYLFEGWFEDGAFTIPFTSDRMPARDLCLYAKWKEHSYTVTFDANGGTVSQTSKVVYCGGIYGMLPEPSYLYYDFLGWFTESSGGIQKTDDTSANTSPAAETLYAHWQRRTFTLNYNANSGTVNPTNKIVNCGASYGELPTPILYYNNFLGWFTASTGGSLVNASTVADNTTTPKTIYAHWELKPLSDWVIKGQEPADSQVDTQHKWTYTLTTTKKSKETSMSGFTQISSEWVQSGTDSSYYATFPSGFSTGHTFYTSYMKAPYADSETTTAKRTVSSVLDGYIYWKWMYDCGGSSAGDRVIAEKSGTGFSGFNYKYFIASISYTNYTQSYSGYIGYYYSITNMWQSYNESLGSRYWYRFDRNKSTYIDYYKMFTYQKVEQKESTTYPQTASSEEVVSNIKEWIRYREK